MQRYGTIPFIFLVLAFALIVISFTDRGQAREEPTSVALLPPPDLVRELAETREDLQRAQSLLFECFGHPVDLKQVKSIPVTITAYSSTVKQCDSSPHITASDKPVRVGILSVSHDLLREMGLSFGQRVLLPGYGLFEVRDMMHPRWRQRVDIWESDREAARLFGLQQGTLIWVDAKKKSA